MEFTMNLWSDSFEALKNKTKTMEMRLNDEKRSLIKTDDIIVFVDSSTKETISCKVIKVSHYKSFFELYLHHDKISIGYKDDEIANPEDMLSFYSQEKIDKYGVIGIEIRIME